MVSNPHNVDPDRSVDCVFCDELADERETIDLWNKPRFPDGEAHTNCYDVWTDKPTYVVLALNDLEAAHPDDPDAGDHLKVGVRAAYLDRDSAEEFVENATSNAALVEADDDIRPDY